MFVLPMIKNKDLLTLLFRKSHTNCRKYHVRISTCRFDPWM